MPSCTRRVVDDELDELFEGLVAIAMDGAKGVGKTEAALQRARTVHRLDDHRERELHAAAPGLLTVGEPPVLIDEWQRVPESWDLVRRAVDAGAPVGSFVLSGSATAAGAAIHSGAGRIVSVRMRPLTLSERGVGSPSVSLAGLLLGSHPELSGSTGVELEDYATEIVRSGFPGLRDLSGRAGRAQLESYVERIVERDFEEELGRTVRNPAALLRWMRAYAAATSTCASHEAIRDAASSNQHDKPARSTTLPYRDAFERLWIVDPVPAWLPTGNRPAELAAASKHQLVDAALVAVLLGIDEDALLAGRDGTVSLPRGGTLVGALFESLVALSVRVFAQQAEARVRHLRTWRGEHEVDLIVERRDGRILAIEVKLTAVVKDDDVKHLRWLKGRLGDDLLDAIVVTTGRDAYRRRDGIGVVPAALLGP